jgi:hypothetical protein
LNVARFDLQRENVSDSSWEPPKAKKASINKSEEVRQLLKANPKITAKEAIDMLAGKSNLAFPKVGGHRVKGVDSLRGLHHGRNLDE